MLATLLLLLQASAGLPPLPRHDPPPANLAALTTACPGAPTGEIIVCGTRQTDRYRLPPLAPADAPRLGPAEFSIAGARVGVATEQGNIGPIPTNRVMAHIRIHF